MKDETREEERKPESAQAGDKAERLFQAMEHVKEQYLTESQILSGRREKSNGRRSGKPYLLPLGLGTAACLVLLLWMGAGRNGQNDVGNAGHSSHGDGYIQYEDTEGPTQMPESQQHAAESSEGTDSESRNILVDILLHRDFDKANAEAALRCILVPVAERIAEYYEVELKSWQVDLGDYEAFYELLPGTDNVFYFRDLGCYEYLVTLESDGKFKLWEFGQFQVWDETEQQAVADGIARGDSIWCDIAWYDESLDVGPYSYGMVLETIYGIRSAEDLRAITVAPGNMDSTDAGKKLQREIGTMEITDPEQIETIYQILTGLICLGGGKWNVIFPADQDVDSSESMLERVRQTRYLTLHTDNSLLTDICTLKYTAVSDRFYEYGGIAYEALTQQQASVVEQILGIH